jgi:hypothetical protein
MRLSTGEEVKLRGGRALLSKTLVLSLFTWLITEH